MVFFFIYKKKNNKKKNKTKTINLEPSQMDELGNFNWFTFNIEKREDPQ